MINGNFNIRVAPEVMVEKSGELTKKIKRMRQDYEELQALIEKTKGYWIGIAGETHRQVFCNSTNTIETMFSRLSEYPVDLISMAQRYSDVELKIQEDVQTLPGDILQ